VAGDVQAPLTVAIKTLQLGLSSAAFRHSRVVIVGLMAASLNAQPATLVTIPQPTSGPAVFDAAGNLYYRSGPTTPGAAQTRPGGGTCFMNAFPIGGIPQPCPDAGVVKVDSAGNVVFGTLLGGDAADQTTAIAVDGDGNIYFAGTTNMNGILGTFPTTPNAAFPASTKAHAFAAKLSADGSRFLYVTCLPDTVDAPVRWRPSRVVRGYDGPHADRRRNVRPRTIDESI